MGKYINSLSFKGGVGPNFCGRSICFTSAGGRESSPPLSIAAARYHRTSEPLRSYNVKIPLSYDSETMWTLPYTTRAPTVLLRVFFAII